MARSGLAFAVATLAACAGGMPRTSVRNPTQADFSRCYTTASEFNANIQGKLQLECYLRKDGSCSASFVRNSSLKNGQLEKCVAFAATGWRLPGRADDSFLYFDVSVTIGVQGEPQIAMPSEHDVPVKGALEKDVAAGSLTFADFADADDRGWAAWAMDDYAKAKDEFAAALKANPADPEALRGMAVSLVGLGGDLAEARKDAAAAVKVAPTSPGAEEALTRVCLAQKDKECAFDSFEAAIKADPTGAARGLELKALEPEVRDTAQALKAEDEQHRAAEKEQNEKAAQKAAEVRDPSGCGKVEGAERAKCLVAYCMKAGVRKYAGKLKELTGGSYTPGEFTSKDLGNGAFMVVTTLSSSGDKKIFSWKFTTSDNLIKAQDVNASEIGKTREYNACMK